MSGSEHENWILIKVKNKNGEFYKIMFFVKGEYTGEGDIEISTEVKSVSYHDGTYKFLCKRGMKYFCKEENYGMTVAGSRELIKLQIQNPNVYTPYLEMDHDFIMSI